MTSKIIQAMPLVMVLMSLNLYAEDNALDLSDESSVDTFYSGDRAIYGQSPMRLADTGGWVCTSRQQEARGNCTTNAPDQEGLEWRYVAGHGYRKFSPGGANRLDWDDYRRTRQLPFLDFYLRAFPWLLSGY